MEKTFESKENPENIIFDLGEEDWIEEEKEVAVLSEEEVTEEEEVDKASLLR